MGFYSTHAIFRFRFTEYWKLVKYKVRNLKNIKNSYNSNTGLRLCYIHKRYQYKYSWGTVSNFQHFTKSTKHRLYAMTVARCLQNHMTYCLTTLIWLKHENNGRLLFMFIQYMLRIDNKITVNNRYSIKSN